MNDNKTKGNFRTRGDGADKRDFSGRGGKGTSGSYQNDTRGRSDRGGAPRSGGRYDGGDYKPGGYRGRDSAGGDYKPGGYRGRDSAGGDYKSGGYRGRDSAGGDYKPGGYKKNNSFGKGSGYKGGFKSDEHRDTRAGGYNSRAGAVSDRPRSFSGSKSYSETEYEGRKGYMPLDESPEIQSDTAEREPREDVICGRNSVLEALKSGRPAESLMVSRGEHTGSMGQIIALAKKKEVTVKEVSPAKLDFLCGSTNHQGVAFICAAAATITLEELMKRPTEKGEDDFYIICDGIKDPHNLGAIIRTAEAVGAHGVIIPKRRSAGLTAAAAKAASGALEYVPVAKVTNLAACLDTLRENGVWIYCADMDGEDYRKTELSGKIAIVIGSEGEGVGRLVKEKCDGAISMPMKGRVNSLNASVAAGIIMYRALECRSAE